MRVRQPLQDFIRDYWPYVVAIAVFLAALVRFLMIDAKGVHITAFAAAATGFVFVLAAGELSEWTGSYGWTREQHHTHSEEFVRLAGGLILIGSRRWSMQF